MMKPYCPDGEIFIVDDDPTVCNALGTLFALQGYQVESFADGGSFLAAAHARRPACILLDINMPGRSGIEIVRELHARGYPAPVFLISEHVDVALAVSAIKSGAFDLIEKPFNVEAVLGRVQEAIASLAPESRENESGFLNRFPGCYLLTPREREVLKLVTSGASNKEAGQRLKISPRTIEVHRARIMIKLGARNAADLVRIVLSESRAAH